MIYLNGKEVSIKSFPNGESLIESTELDIRDKNIIKVRFEDDRDITRLIFLKGHLDEKGLKTSLELLYMPYSRMDRTEGVTVFTLKYLANFINSLNFDCVKIYEAHSDVSVALLDRVLNVDMTKVLAEELLEEIGSKEDLYLVFPDAGATKRYSKQIKYDKIITANKERDFKTGRIKNLTLNGEVNSDKFDCIIVDDLCSKGGTFIYAAEKLKEIGADKIYLVVTHCENSIFEGDILKTDLINKVYTTNSILNREDKKIIVKNII